MSLFGKEYLVFYKITYGPYPSVNAHAFIKARSVSHLQKKLENKHPAAETISITKVEKCKKKGGFL